MKERRSQYPDISDILARKSLGRKERGRLGFAQKLDILDALKARAEPFVQARTARARRKTRTSLARARS
jgi:hypothetical protein